MRTMVGFWRSLSGRLLVFTVLFVMLAEIFIFVPSVARYREEFIKDKIDKAHIASLSVQAAGARGNVDPMLEAELLRRAGVLRVSLRREKSHLLMLSAPLERALSERFDFRGGRTGATALIVDALGAFVRTEPRLVAVLGDTDIEGAESIEIVLDEAALITAIRAYGWRIFLLSLFISGVTAVMVFFTVHRFLVRPIRRVIASMMSFRDDPEDAGRIIAPSGARGEMGMAERELAEQQRAVAKALQQKSRLAALGEAVAKINHDLRNILSSAQLFADRLESSRDPAIARVGPKLVRSLDRAVRLCQQTLAYGKADEPPPEFAHVELSDLAAEVAAALDLSTGGRNGAGATAHVAFVNGVPDGLAAVADPDQLFRAVLNLARNSKQAIEAQGRGGVISIEGRRRDGSIEIDVVDDGPGLPEKAKESLFKAFKGSVRQGGTGLGMAIAAELVRAQGGDLSLVESSSIGARFRVRLPNRADPLAAAMGEGGWPRRLGGKATPEPASEFDR